MMTNTRPTMGQYLTWNDKMHFLCKGDLVCPHPTFIPDGWTLDLTTTPITGTLIEYSSVFSHTAEKRATSGGDKHCKYLTCLLFLQKLMPRCKIQLQTYVMSIHTEYTQPEWDTQLQSYKISLDAARTIQEACVLAAIEVFHALASLRRVLREEAHGPGGPETTST